MRLNCLRHWGHTWNALQEVVHVVRRAGLSHEPGPLTEASSVTLGGCFHHCVQVWQGLDKLIHGVPVSPQFCTQAGFTCQAGQCHQVGGNAGVKVGVQTALPSLAWPHLQASLAVAWFGDPLCLELEARS